MICVTLRIGDPRAQHVIGSTVGKCARCNHDVNLPPSTQRGIAGGFVEVVCLGCITAREIQEAAKEPPHILPGQIAEVRDHFARQNRTGVDGSAVVGTISKPVCSRILSQRST